MMKRILYLLLSFVILLLNVTVIGVSSSGEVANKSKYLDVPEYASYFDDVNILSSLNIISGFDDSSFRPDEFVTRAQMAKMIVEALNEGEQAEASKKLSQFTDVTNHWANGYINQGVADVFISGYGDGTFGPDDNVTFVQAQSMLVRAIGYETYAEGSGGYPNGYKTWAASQGITCGMTGLPDDKKLTRAEVAKLIYNTMNVPICVIKDYETTLDGKRVPNLEIKDDEGKDYQNLFTKKHNVFKVKGYLKNSNTFVVTQADNFDDEYYPESSSKEVNIPTSIGWNGGSQVIQNDYYGSKYLNIQCTAFLLKDIWGSWSIMYMTDNDVSIYGSLYDIPVETPKPTTAPTPKPTEKPNPTAEPKETEKPTPTEEPKSEMKLTYEEAEKYLEQYLKKNTDSETYNDIIYDCPTKAPKPMNEGGDELVYEFFLKSKSDGETINALYVHENGQVTTYTN